MLAAIETTGDTCGIALFEGNQLLAELHVALPRAHDRLLATLFQQSLDVVGKPAADLSAIAVSTGPGSYTGIRIGVSFAIGLALGTGVPIIPVPTLDAIAYSLRTFAKAARRSRVLSVIPAGRLGLYASLFQVLPEFLRLTDAGAIPPQHLPALLDENVLAAGPGILQLKSQYSDCIAYGTAQLTARAIGEHAIFLQSLGLTCSPEQIEPLYIG
ncbi:MAG: tRNA (adenosine(37)-N6)-threonylcarbamoyltransferase complex dimerization subunit type 1 TsaB [Armatimonadetes bacterium]|nr:tRNA (adenosine(37)-N6)-threonylcarbamoyltransferase complex dimerization subunit type 1 TsaB [Armatimonadota bacterium]